jgi:mono/diheme cytochrome c family protein
MTRRWYSRLVVLGPLILCGCGAVPGPPGRRTATQRPVTASATALGVGLATFHDNGCGSCHTFVPAGAGGSVGPDLDTKPEQDARRANMPIAAFVRRSIVDPNAYISPGYPKNVMPHGFGRKLSKRQLTDLVAFVATPASR